jgi:endonuclease/exonuclease/phosphatase family metal-dependent hydrolase
LALFVKKSWSVKEEGERFVHQEKGYTPSGDLGLHARNIQFVTLETPKGLSTIINFHGLWNGGGKTDTEHRLSQSRKIIDFMKTLDNDFILCGDFNLEPTTQSLKMFENFGLKNLVKDFNITSTRTKFYTKAVKFADYAFVSPGVDVNDFKVLPDEVSDHSPLYIDIE